jgi:hypothetical protein
MTDPTYNAGFAAGIEAEVMKLRKENERLRSLVFAAYCEGWIEAGGGVLVDNKWAQSECRAALKGEHHD